MEHGQFYDSCSRENKGFMFFLMTKNRPDTFTRFLHPLAGLVFTSLLFFLAKENLLTFFRASSLFFGLNMQCNAQFYNGKIVFEAKRTQNIKKICHPNVQRSTQRVIKNTARQFYLYSAFHYNYTQYALH